MGNIWVGGTTTSENFPLRDLFQTASGQDFNPSTGTGFLVKLAPDGTVIYSSYFGGLLGNSGVKGVGTDQTGNLYVTGTTDSGDFPTTPGLPAAMVTANEITSIFGAFITKLDATGQHILYSALLAGTAIDCNGGSSCFLMSRVTVGASIAVDGAGNAYLTGFTNDPLFPATPGAYQTKLNATPR